MKRILVQFTFPDLDEKVYEGVIKDLEAAGKGTIPERLYHVAAPNGKDWNVTDVWESEESFAKFGEVMVPLLIKNGGKPVAPVILPVYNILIP